MIAFLLIYFTHALDPQKLTGEVSFEATVHPSSFKIRGKGARPACNLNVADEKISGECSFDLTTLDTENQTRNGHMRTKYLETDKYPKAKMTFEQVPLRKVTQAYDAPLTGQLELHGIKKPIAGSVKIIPGPKTLDADATFDVKLSDHGITQPSFAGITVDDVIKVKIHTSTPNE